MDLSARIKSICKNVLFLGIDEKYLLTIATCLELQSIQQNDFVYSKGDIADGLYFVISGELEIFTVRKNETYVLSHASAPYLFGEFLLCGYSIRSTSAKATIESEVLFFSRENFNNFVKEFPDQGALVSERVINRLTWNQTSLALRLSPLFVGLSEEIVRTLINEMELQFIPSDSFLTRQNDLSLEMWIVIDGQFEVNKLTKEGKLLNLATLRRGEVIGEIGVTSDSPRRSNVLATRDSTVSRLSRSSFESLLKKYPIEINKAFITSVARHLDRTAVKSKSAETFALVVLSSRLDSQSITEKFLSALRQYDSVIAVNSKNIDVAFSKMGVAQSNFDDSMNKALLQWLSEQEIAYNHVVYVVDDSLSNWTQRCLRQADHIIFCVDASDNPEINEFEKLVLDTISNKPVKKTLVVIHPDNTDVPSNTADWIKRRDINIHHHVKVNSTDDFEKVARFLIGKAVGLVLGGGGARGFTHLGVIRAFKELGVPIDIIAGNSMGAIIAAQYAMKLSNKKILKDTQKLCLAGDRFTLPLLSIFSGKKMITALEKIFGDSHIEDLWLHFFSISCNISRATIMTHDEGSLLAGVLNSNVPPGLFPPQVVNGDLLVDGALLNNVPVDVMASRNEAGTIIAVDINAREDLLNNADHTGGMSGWRLFFNKLNPRSEKIKMPSILEVLARSSIIGGLAQRKKLMNGVADIYLQPPLNKFSLMAHKDAEEIEEIGYQYTKKELQHWLERKKTTRF